MKRLIELTVAAALVLAVASPGPAKSIWARAEGRNGARAVQVYQDDKARHVGDILTIIISEQSSVDSETSRKGEKQLTRSIDTAGNIQTNDVGQWWGRRGTKLALPTITAASDAKSAFDGKAEYESDRTILDQISVTVHDILPNGCLVVLGTRQREVDGDAQIIQVSGIVRPSDITFANSVQSGRVADFRMVVRIKGLETGWTRPGWFGRLLNWLSPW